MVLVSLPGVVQALRGAVARRSASTTILSAGRTSLAIRVNGPLRTLMEIPTFSSCGPSLGELHAPGAISSAIERAVSSRENGALATLGGRTLRFRVGPAELRRALQGPLEAQLGWVNDPKDWDVNVEVVDGAIVAELGPLFRSRRLGALARTSSATNPVAAAYMAELAAIPDGVVVADPFCGSGTLLVEAARISRPARLIGSDSDPAALEAARTNLGQPPAGTAGRVVVPPHVLEQWDARELRQLWTTPVERVLADLPFGKRVGSHAANAELYFRFLDNVDKCLAPDGVAVLLTEHKSALRNAIRRIRGLRVRSELGVTVGGLDPSIYVVDRPPSARRRLARRRS